MASKKKLREWNERQRMRIEELRGLYFELNDEVLDLEGDWKAQATEYEADLNAARSREAIAVEKLAAMADQATTLDRAIRERDKALRELQAARVAAEALGKALYPMTYAKGGLLGGLIGSAPEVPKYTFNVGTAAGETYDSIMGLMNKSWKPQAYQQAVNNYAEGRTPPIADSPGPGWRELGKQPFGGADTKPDA